MLLPSALPCDPSQTPPLTRLQTALFASPPASPPQLSTQTAIGNIFSSCRSLQSLLNNPPPPVAAAQEEPITPPASSRAQLPTPPLAHAQPPLKLRLRSRKADTASTASGDHGPARKRIVKRTSAVAQQPPRGVNKRRRAVDDDMGRGNNSSDNNNNNNNKNNNCDEDSDMEQRQAHEEHMHNGGHDRREHDAQQASAPHTPKRSRIAPEVIPLGLERADYHSLHSSFSSSFDGGGDMPAPAHSDANHANKSNNHYSADLDSDRPGTDVVVEADGEMWSTEEDRILVELVLEKLKLSKSDWQDCARSLGKDRGSVGRRWKSLMINGDVGLKKGCSRRARLHGTWR